MLVVTTENVAGHRVVEVKGQCFGVVVRSRGLGGNMMAGLRSVIGGEVHEYTHLLEDTRRQAVDRLVQNASVMGANAVLMLRFDSSEIGQTMSEIVGGLGSHTKNPLFYNVIKVRRQRDVRPGHTGVTRGVISRPFPGRNARMAGVRRLSATLSLLKHDAGGIERDLAPAEGFTHRPFEPVLLRGPRLILDVLADVGTA
jgi:uncharacterized protein YbjQ (UPF0145 family)